MSSGTYIDKSKPCAWGHYRRDNTTKRCVTCEDGRKRAMHLNLKGKNQPQTKDTELIRANKEIQRRRWECEDSRDRKAADRKERGRL